MTKNALQDALEKTWDLVLPGGIVVIDDFFHKVQGPARGLGQRGAVPGVSGSRKLNMLHSGYLKLAMEHGLFIDGFPMSMLNDQMVLEKTVMESGFKMTKDAN